MNFHRTAFAFLCITTACTLGLSAQTLSGDALRENLHLKTKTSHSPISYGAARGALEVIYSDPDNAENILLFYSARSQDADKWVGSDGRNGWNREHLWPQSRGMRAFPMKADLHNLKPTDASINQARGNLNFDEGGSPEGEAPDTFLDGDSFEPRDAVKGDVARAMFYVDVRYEGTGGEPDLELVDDITATGGQTIGDLCTLMAWHIADPVTPEEITQNDVIEGFQGNRNPFVDDPTHALRLHGEACGIAPPDGVETASGTSLSSLKIATWNIANLHHESGVALRDRAEPRDDVDYDRLAALAGSMNWDIVALQEMGSPKAVRRVFAESDYHLVMSDRYASGDEDRPANERDIYTAMVFAKSTFPMPPTAYSFSSLSIDHVGIDRDGTASVRPTRAAIVAELDIAGEPVKIMGVHLKSSCHRWSLDPVVDQSPTNGRPFSSRFDCRTLAAQLNVLESWIEQQSAIGVTTLVLGDFNRQLNSLNSAGAPNDDFWLALNDGTPNGLSLAKGPLGFDTVCWPNHAERFEDHIDFAIYDAALSDTTTLSAPEKHSMGFETDARYADRARQKLSDHCPVDVVIQW